MTELKLHKTKIVHLEQKHYPGRQIIEALEEPRDQTKECNYDICKTPEKIHLRLENEKSRFTFLAEHVDCETWSTLKRFIERTINENFQQQSPEPKRKKVRCTADRNENNDNMSQQEAEDTTKQVNTVNMDEMEMDYEDYSDMDLILPLEGSPTPAPDE